MIDLQEKLQRTPLYEEHLKLKAKMVPFGGWEMPVQYQGILDEHAHTRKAATVFDTCHMGEFIIEGDYALSGLDRIVTMRLIDIPLKSSRYGFLLNDKGTVLDDLIVFRISEEKWLLVVNGATIQKDAKHIVKNLTSKAKFEDISSQTGKIDLQGPRSREFLIKLAPAIQKLEYYTFDYFSLLGENVLISRTGYTGELGYEIFYPSGRIKSLWQELLKNETIRPAGLGARDLLRLEVGYSLYGHELNEKITPLEAGLERFIDFSKDFIGKEALLKQKEQGVPMMSIGLISDTRRSPRDGHQIFNSSEEPIGIVSSGGFSPELNKGIGLGFVARDAVKRGEKIYFGDEKNKISAMMSGKIFYKDGSIKN